MSEAKEPIKSEGAKFAPESDHVREKPKAVPQHWSGFGRVKRWSVMLAGVAWAICGIAAVAACGMLCLAYLKDAPGIGQIATLAISTISNVVIGVLGYKLGQRTQEIGKEE